MSKLTFEEIKDEVNIACIELMQKFPFYGHIVVQLPKIFLEEGNRYGIPTLGVGKDSKEELLIKLYICVDYLQHIYENFSNEIAFAHLKEVIKHEILHIVFNHLSFDMPDKARRAVAVDLAVNSYCVRENFVVEKIETKNGIKECPPLYPEDYQLPSKKSCLFYYNALLKNKKFKEQCINGSFGAEGLMSNVVKSHELWDMACQDPMLKEMIKDLVRKSSKLCQESKNWGDTPSDIIEQITKLTEHEKAKLPWQSIVRLFCSSAMEYNLDYTMKRKSKRFGIRPGTKKVDILNLAIGIDVSGSIKNSQLKIFFNELYWLSKNQGVKITVFEADTRIQREYPFSQFDEKVKGRGGTDLEPILEEVTKRKFDALIYFTDFYAPVIKKVYNIPILWVLSECDLSEEQYPYKYGMFMKLDDYDEFSI